MCWHNCSYLSPHTLPDALNHLCQWFRTFWSYGLAPSSYFFHRPLVISTELKPGNLFLKHGGCMEFTDKFSKRNWIVFISLIQLSWGDSFSNYFWGTFYVIEISHRFHPVFLFINLCMDPAHVLSHWQWFDYV